MMYRNTNMLTSCLQSVRFFRGPGMLLAFPCLLLMLSAHAAEFAANLALSTPCAISVSSDLTGNNTITTLPLGTNGVVDGDRLVGSQTPWQVADGTSAGPTAVTPFYIQLKNCNSWSSTVPKINIQGAVSPVSDSDNKMFSDGTGTSTGFGVVVFPKLSPTLGADELVNDDDFEIPGVGAQTWLTGNKSIPMSAGVTCGPVANCTSQLAAGTLSASVTFTLKYQ